MNAIKKITIKNLKLNSKRNLGMMIGIILAVMLICMISFFATTFHKLIVDIIISDGGYYHLVLNDLEKEDIEVLKRNQDIKHIYLASKLSDMKYHKDEKEYPFERLSMDEDTAYQLSYFSGNGNYPKNETEIVVNKYFLEFENYQIGDTITLYESENEKKEYKIVGTMEHTGYLYQAITSKTSNDQTISAYIALKKPFSYKKTIPLLLNLSNYEEVKHGESKKYPNYALNEALLKVEVFDLDDVTIKMITGFASISLFLVLIVSIFCIKNSFMITIAEKRKLYGMLGSVGATRKQIKKSVVLEGIILGFIGIPLGILIGIIGTQLILLLMNMILGPYFFPSIKRLTMHFSIFPVILSFVLGIFAIYFSSMKAAKKASHYSPIENIRNASDIKISSKKLKIPNRISDIFQIGGVIAYKNLKRSKKKYRPTILSLIISVSVFIIMSSFIIEGFQEIKKQFLHYDYNILITNIGDFSLEEIQKIESLKEVKNSYFTYQSSYLENDFKSSKGYFQIFDLNKIAPQKGYNIVVDGDCKWEEYTVCTSGHANVRIIGLSDPDFKHYMEKLGLNYEKLKDKGILLDEFEEIDYQSLDSYKVIKKRKYRYQEKEMMTGIYQGKEISIEIGKAGLSIYPSGAERSKYGPGSLVLNTKYYSNLDFALQSMALVTKKTNEVAEELSKINEHFEIVNIDQEEKESKALYVALTIALCIFVLIVTLVTFTNVFHTITSNMRQRQREFATLKSIGMTKKEFRHMINLEVLFYSVKSLIIGILFGTCGSYFVHQILNRGEKIPYQFPYSAVILSILFVFLFVFFVMHYSMSKIKGQNIIETIRNENI